MVEIFIAFILIVFFGLFVALSFPMKDEAAKLNKNTKPEHRASKIQNS